DRQRADAALVVGQKIPACAKSATGLARKRLLGKQFAYRNRQAGLLPERRRALDAGAKRSAAARSALFRSAEKIGRTAMLFRGAMSAMALAAMLCAAPYGAFAFDDAMYPDLSGQWIGLRMPSCRGQPSFDPVKCWGTTQDAPLTPE